MLEHLFALKIQVPLFNFAPGIIPATIFLLILSALSILLEIGGMKLIKYKYYIFAGFFAFAGGVLYFFEQITSFLSGFFSFITPGSFFPLTGVGPLVFEILALYLVLGGALFVLTLILFRSAKAEILQDIRTILYYPAMEELIYRFLILSLLLANNIAIPTAVGITAVLFALAPGHVFQKNMGSWSGYYRPYDTLIFGILWGFAAIHFGILYAFAMHAIGNLIGAICAKIGILKAPEGTGKAVAKKEKTEESEK